ncbi:MAG: primosomal protein N' (replication factor Y) (superfamily II helicase) [Gammaproteobacteria bacterium]|nr:MAG: primosomal protein N' (replication factor Y) (superfamily II helicase) [Gammaproteobacteria bacterium]
MTGISRVLRVAVPSPLCRLFDYLPPPGCDIDKLVPGIRLRVPFGPRHTIGMLIEVASASQIDPQRLKAALEMIDDEPLVGRDLQQLLHWAITYYHHAPGDVMFTALPALLRQGRAPDVAQQMLWRASGAGTTVRPEQLARAPRQAALLALLQGHPAGLTAADLAEQLDFDWRAALRTLTARGWIERHAVAATSDGAASGGAAGLTAERGPELNAAQRVGADRIVASLGGYAAFLLDGVTGSGKTEVYLQALARVVAAGGQALVLVPEIGLTPQLVARFEQRLGITMALYHSGLTDRERLHTWLAARAGQVPVVIGTRSALFVPLKRPALLIVDEEHDLSFKQQEGFRYHARDLAVVRARNAGVPIVLGSATPSLESLYNVAQERYQHLTLKARAGVAEQPPVHLIDVRRQPLHEGLSDSLLQAIARHVAQGNQVLLFLNRRGYAPTLLCHDCGWMSKCERCDAHMTFHLRQQRLRCHHCGAERAAVEQCPGCGGQDLLPVGEGTERIERVLHERFGDTQIVRIDRDTTRRKGAMQEFLDSAAAGGGRILIGTQMLAKGHHLPGVTLVGIVNTDQGLFGADFRALERMAQLIVQVSGRAGRADKPGEVLIQTHHPDHPLLRTLVHHGYAHFAREALAEREQACLPPHMHLALLRAEAVDRDLPPKFLSAAKSLAQDLAVAGVELLGPVPAPMERRGGRYRAQLLVQAGRRADLHRLLTPWVPQLETVRLARKVRWSLDVDPQEMV